MAEGEVGAVAPVATPVAADQATIAPEVTATPEQGQPDKPERTFTQKELDEIVQKRLSKESRRLERVARAEAEAAWYKQQLESRDKPAPQRQPDGKPQEKDFEGRPYSEYVEALAEWKADQKFQAKAKESAAEQQQREAQSQVTAARDRLMKDARDIPDFEDVALAEDLPISPAMARAIVESDAPAKVAHYLGQHPDEASRIFDLPITKQIREIAKIEEKLSAPPKPTATPPPIVPNKPAAPVEKRLQDADIDEFFAIRKRQIAAKKGR